jgi:putative ABC transport system permease protein
MWLLSLRDLQWRRRRFAIAVGATGLVFAMSLLMAGVSTTLHNEPRRIIAAVDADAWIVAEGASGPFTTSEVIAAAAADRVADTRGVRRADPLIALHSTIRDGALKDVNLIGFRVGGVGSPPVEEGRAPRREGEAVADVALGVDPGDTVVVSGRRLRVVGLADDVTFYFGTPTLFAPIEDVQALAFGGQPLAMAIVTRGTPETVPDGLAVMTDDAVRRDLERVLTNGSESIDFMNVLLFLVAAGIVGSMIYLSALERSRDFAVLKATGAGNGGLLAGLALQAVVLSVAAAAVAAVLARLLGPTFPFEVELTAAAVARLAVVAVVIGLVASAIGFRRVAGADPALAFGGS